MTNGKRKARQTMIYKTLHRKPKIEQHILYENRCVNSGVPEGKQFLLQTRWQIMNEEMTGLLLRPTDQTRSHLWHRYFVKALWFSCAIKFVIICISNILALSVTDDGAVRSKFDTYIRFLLTKPWWSRQLNH